MKELKRPCQICRDHKPNAPFKIRDDDGILYKTSFISNCPYCGRFLSENYQQTMGNKSLMLPDVSEQDRQSMHDFLHNCFAAWIDDPAVGLHGMDEGEAELENAIMDALDTRKPEGSDHDA